MDTDRKMGKMGFCLRVRTKMNHFCDVAIEERREDGETQTRREERK